ncbi:hypothetical protein, partial [Bacteroides sp. 224]|uniref:hypothetical protein n=1 Tax=Bacteroides sp. 224 TaxID=2302936 RepID=UPI001940256B
SIAIIVGEPNKGSYNPQFTLPLATSFCHGCFITIIYRSYTINFYNASRYCSHRAAPRIAVQYSFYSKHQKKKEDCADTPLVRMKCPVTAIAVLHYSFA